MEKVKCKNPICENEVDALHMDDEGYCNDCHDKILDGLLIEESEETKFMSDKSLLLMCTYPIRVRSSRPSVDFRKKPYH